MGVLASSLCLLLASHFRALDGAIFSLEVTASSPSRSVLRQSFLSQAILLNDVREHTLTFSGAIKGPDLGNLFLYLGDEGGGGRPLALA